MGTSESHGLRPAFMRVHHHEVTNVSGGEGLAVPPTARTRLCLLPTPPRAEYREPTALLFLPTIDGGLR